MKEIESPFTLGLPARNMPVRYARIPILGRCLWYFMRPSKWSAYLSSLKEQIEERGSVSDDLWPSEDHREIAKKITEILMQRCWGESLHFIPHDPYYIIGEFEIGDLSECEAMMDIEDHFKLKFLEIDKKTSFGQVVSYIQGHKDTE